MNVGALWRNEDDTGSGNVQGWEQRIEMTWRYRQTTIFGSFRNSLLYSDANDQMFQTFLLSMRREF